MHHQIKIGDMYMEITKEEALKRFNQLLKYKEELEERAERVFQILNWSL